uniref:Pectinesterase inhibitor domain containing protein n=1 Tax=Zea mays TaxID=4577 RepID=B6U0Q5_MAIZE|nr:pectinesterase inhibitor domain containing protein [Zea mays]
MAMRSLALLVLLSLLVVGVAQAVELEMELVPADAIAMTMDREPPQECATPVSVEEACRSASETHAGVAYDHCMASLGADLLRDALDNLKAKIYGKAMEQLTAAMGASESCEDAWKGEEDVPVAAHDREYGRMAHIAFGFTHHAAAAA